MKYFRRDLRGCIAMLLAVCMLLAGCGLQKNTNAVDLSTAKEDIEDLTSDAGAEGLFYNFADVKAFVETYEEGEVSVGIDVSKWQGTIDWQAVADAGVDFAFIRVGYRAANTGVIFEDPYAKYNLQQAHAAGIKLGAYFFSTAITLEEALEEAAWTCAYIAQYPITYPVAYNCEGFKTSENRHYNLSNDIRSENAMAFLELVESQGYQGMFYASKNELQNSNYWNTKTIESKYGIWVSQYPGTSLQENPRTTYTGEHDCWQFTYKGIVPGISRNVDVDIAYFEPEKIAEPKDLTPYDMVEPPQDAVSYTAILDVVMANSDVALKQEPSEEVETVATLRAGEVVQRIAVSSSGWSLIEYNGNYFYGLTRQLETVSQQK